MARLPELSYAAVTPARNEGENLPRLAESLAAQTILPDAWIVVDDGSTDSTLDIATKFSRSHPWTAVAPAPRPGSEAPLERGRLAGRDVAAFIAGVKRLGRDADIVVKLDADVSLPSDFFARLLGAFEADPSLGIASGGCWEFHDGAWREIHVTGSHARGATRAYRRACLEDVLPLEERIGWDGIDEVKAHLRGWRTAALVDLPFYHHRPMANRDGARRWAVQGSAAHYMGYRFSYLLLRSLFQARREAAALAMIPAYLRAVLGRAPRCPDPAVCAHVRREQRLRKLPLRAREASGIRR